eukprot:108256-Alexandrium_andersonii.AAC.1
MPPTQPECSPPSAAPRAEWKAGCPGPPQYAGETLCGLTSLWFQAYWKLPETRLPVGNSG